MILSTKWSNTNYCDDGVLYDVKNPEQIKVEMLEAFPPESGINIHDGKGGTIKREGVWVTALKYLGLIYIPASLVPKYQSAINEILAASEDSHTNFGLPPRTTGPISYLISSSGNGRDVERTPAQKIVIDAETDALVSNATVRGFENWLMEKGITYITNVNLPLLEKLVQETRNARSEARTARSQMFEEELANYTESLTNQFSPESTSPSSGVNPHKIQISKVLSDATSSLHSPVSSTKNQMLQLYGDDLKNIRPFLPFNYSESINAVLSVLWNGGYKHLDPESAMQRKSRENSVLTVKRDSIIEILMTEDVHPVTNPIKYGPGQVAELAAQLFYDQVQSLHRKTKNHDPLSSQINLYTASSYACNYYLCYRKCMLSKWQVTKRYINFYDWLYNKPSNL